MRSLRAAIVAAGLALVVATPAAAQVNYYFSGCNLQGTCGTATLFVQVSSTSPDRGEPTLVADVRWADGTSGLLFGPFGANLVPSLAPTFSFSDSSHLCAYGWFTTTVSSCTGRWFPDFTTIPIAFVPDAVEIRVGYGIDAQGRPLSTSVLTLSRVPEPATVALLGGGLLALGGVGAVRRRLQA